MDTKRSRGTDRQERRRPMSRYREVTKAAVYSFLVLISFSAVLVSQAVAGETGTVVPTPYSMDFYGAIEGAVKGDVVAVYDGNGVICGIYTVTKDGSYGFLHVYGDDRTTPADEGAEKDEVLTFTLNGQPLVTTTGVPVVWVGDGFRQRTDFIRR
jgi:hypothetical protein